MNKVVHDLLRMLPRLIGEDITITTKLDPGLWAVRGDVGRLEQVIMNLAINARDAMFQGGKLTITTKNVTIDEKYCRRYNYARPGRFIGLSVEDTGVGMDKETIEYIFEPFFSTKDPGRG